jgi:hypothetical protein
MKTTSVVPAALAVAPGLPVLFLPEQASLQALSAAVPAAPLFPSMLTLYEALNTKGQAMLS